MGIVNPHYIDMLKWYDLLASIPSGPEFFERSEYDLRGWIFNC